MIIYAVNAAQKFRNVSFTYNRLQHRLELFHHPSALAAGYFLGNHGMNPDKSNG